jgi:hypothetical protein
MRICTLLAALAALSACAEPHAPVLLSHRPFCTRTLGDVECWSNPDSLPGQPLHPLVDGPDKHWFKD